MTEQGPQPQRAPQPKRRLGGPMVLTSYTIPLTFSSGTNGSTTSMDMSSVNDMDNDDVVVYSASGATPSSQRTGTTDRRGSYANPHAALPSNLAGGAWSANTNFWVQIVNTTQGKWWEGSVTATTGTVRCSVQQK